MFYFKSTIDKKLKYLDNRICKLENENRKLKSSLENQGINTDQTIGFYIPTPNLKNLDRKFKLLLKKLNLRVVIRKPRREIIELEPDDS